MATPHVYRLKTRLLSTTTVHELLQWVTTSLEAGEKVLLVDMQDVMFMDSSGLGALAIAYNKAQKVGAHLALCSLTGQARMIFEMSGMEKMFAVYINLKDFEQATSRGEL